MNCRQIVLGVWVLSCSAGGYAAARAPLRALPPVAEEAPPVPIACQVRRLPRGYGALDAVHVARTGELVVPPGEYDRGLLPLDPRDAASAGGNIYDAAL